MAIYRFEEIKKKLLRSIHEEHIEAELRLILEDKPNEYMIIIYEDHCSFQRCGRVEEQTVADYSTLDEMYKAQQVDDIILERDWDKIIEFEWW